MDSRPSTFQDKLSNLLGFLLEVGVDGRPKFDPKLVKLISKYEEGVLESVYI